MIKKNCQYNKKPIEKLPYIEKLDKTSIMTGCNQAPYTSSRSSVWPIGV